MLIFAFVTLSAFCWAWFGYEIWASRGHPVHLEVVDKHHYPGGEKESPTWFLEVRVGDILGGTPGDTQETPVRSRVFNETEVGHWVTAKVRSFYLGSRRIDKLSVENGNVRRALASGILFSVALAGVIVYS